MSKRHRKLKRSRYNWERTWERLSKPDPAHRRLGGYFTPYRRRMEKFLAEPNIAKIDAGLRAINYLAY